MQYGGELFSVAYALFLVVWHQHVSVISSFYHPRRLITLLKPDAFVTFLSP